MSMINIRRDNPDPFYRYKMPAITSKIEGRGNGIKTAVINGSDVARALNRPPSYVIKYFGIELGAQTQISEDKDRYLVNGQHDAASLQDTLDGFINRFVLCEACKNPETELIITKNGDITRDCKACGKRTPVDIRHKLATFIVKNPPSQAKGKKGAAGAASNTSAQAPDVDDNEDGEPSDDELTKRINAEASELPAAAIRADDDTWAVDTSAEAVAARQREVEQGVAGIALEENDAYTQFGEWCSEGEPSDVEMYKKAMELGIADDPKTVQVLPQVIFDKDIVKQIDEHKGLLTKIVASDEHEKALLGGIERHVGLNHPELIPAVPKILFKLYELDLVSEEVAKKWGTKVSKRYVDKETSKKVRKAAKPFIDWLDEAEEESDSDDE
ncbi:putative eukaryotic translation initiation factor 5 [Yarrowia sp. B02]|nr:putative eukaryotic translation initiation factor 5 [Yarrowia sp. B02]